MRPAPEGCGPIWPKCKVNLNRYLKAARFILFWGLGSALVAWPLLPGWAVGCGVGGAVGGVAILIVFAGREEEARLFFGEIPEDSLSCLGLLWSVIGCIEMIPLLLMGLGIILTGLKLWGVF